MACTIQEYYYSDPVAARFIGQICYKHIIKSIVARSTSNLCNLLLKEQLHVPSISVRCSQWLAMVEKPSWEDWKKIKKFRRQTISNDFLVLHWVKLQCILRRSRFNPHTSASNRALLINVYWDNTGPIKQLEARINYFKPQTMEEN